MKTFICVLLLILFSSIAHALDIKEVSVKCSGTNSCPEKKEQFKRLIGNYRNENHLKNTLKLFATDGGFSLFEFEILSNKSILEINVKLKPVIHEVDVMYRGSKNFPDLPIDIKSDDIFDQSKLDEQLSKLNQTLVSKGYSEVKVTTHIQKVGSGQIDLDINVDLGRPILINNFNLKADSIVLVDYLKGKLLDLQNTPMDMQLFKTRLDEIRRYLFEFGYYNLQIDFEVRKKSNYSVEIDIKTSSEDFYVFEIHGNNRFEKNEILALMKDLLKKFKKSISDTTISQTIKEHYRVNSYKKPVIGVKRKKYTNKFDEVVHRYIITIDEGIRTKLSNLFFSGNEFYSADKLSAFYYDQAFELASLDYYDENYYSYFKEWLKNEYIKQGFVRVDIKNPAIDFSPDQSKVNVEFNIFEGERVYVHTISFKGLTDAQEDEAQRVMNTHLAGAFNPFQFTEDLKHVVNHFKSQGYYFAEITNIGQDNLVVYPKEKSQVDLNLHFSLGNKLTLNRTIIIGNNQTKTKIVSRKIFINQGDVITPQLVDQTEANISATGLFSSVDVYPLKNNSNRNQTDLVVKVKEREYGLVEVAPGYRTDIGLKLSGTYSYQNLGGLNRGIMFRGQINQRLNYQTLDPNRRKKYSSLFEYNTSATYTQGDIFDSLIDYSAGFTLQRKRFYAFDADIIRINNTFSKDLTSKYSVSVRHQLEKIKQFNATNDRDNGAFTIGAITPSFTADYRNSRVNATKGAFFNLSCEFANPYFLSQKNDDLVVNYYKLVSRNRFYLPYKNGALAVSVIGGVQENLATEKKTNPDGSPVLDNGKPITEGYIPSIKVFRLTGMDIVRGFSDEEINRMINGKDIGDERIQTRAYLANIKVEPRYFINDNLIGGLFYDAGRVYVDQVDMGELRSSAGVTFKILTPVGTLDFDYGLKLLRKRNSDGTLESPGRFHVSIGFF